MKQQKEAYYLFESSQSCTFFITLLILFYDRMIQTVDDARLLMRHVDSSLGVPLPDKDYGGNCAIYDANMPDDPWHNFFVIKIYQGSHDSLTE